MGAREMFKQLRAQGVPREEAYLKATGFDSREEEQLAIAERDFVGPPLPPQDNQDYSPTESAYLHTLGGSAMGQLPSLMGGANALLGSGGTMMSRYRDTRGQTVRELEGSAVANPKSSLAGDIAGSAASTAGIGAGVGWLPTLAVGGATGGAVAFGESKADVTKGEYGDAAIDTGIGTAIGVGSAGLLKGGTSLAKAGSKKVGAVANRVRKIWDPEGADAYTTRKAAEEAAKKVSPDKLSEIGRQKPVRSFVERSDQIEQRASGKIGDDFRLRPSQKTGDPALGQLESTATRDPDVFRAAEDESFKQTRQVAELLDKTIDDIAANPKKLGRADVGKDAVEKVQAYVSSLVKERSDTGNRMFGEAAKIVRNRSASFGNPEIIPTANTKKVFAELIQKGEGAYASPEAKALAAKLQKYVDVDHVSITDLQNALSDWGEAATGSGQMFKDIQNMKDQKAAKDVFKALLADLDEAADGAGGRLAEDASSALKAARDMYRQMSNEIDEAGTEAVKRMLKAEGVDATYGITERILKEDPEQIRGVFAVLNKASPETAQQVRAQLFEDVLVKAGKPMRGASYTKSMGANDFSASKAQELLRLLEPKLMAAYEGDHASQMAFRETVDLVDRLAYYPTLIDPPKNMGKEMLDAGGKLYAWTAGGARGSITHRLLSMVKEALTDGNKLAKVTTTPEGIDAVNKALKMIMAAEKSPIDEAAANTLVVTLTQLGLDVSNATGEKIKEINPLGIYKGSN